MGGGGDKGGGDGDGDNGGLKSRSMATSLAKCYRAIVLVLTRSWLVELESSSGKGLDTPSATQLAKMAKRMKISKGLQKRSRTHSSKTQDICTLTNRHTFIN